jgi:hypothetical protein
LLDSTSIVYFSLSSAFVAHAYGSLVLMLYTGACFFVTAFGYWAGLIRLRAPTRQGGALIRLGARFMALALAVSAFLYPWGLALPVLVAGAAGLGLAWSERQWLEFHESTDHNRDSYLAVLQMVTTLGATLIPLGVAGVLWALPGRPSWAVSVVGCVLLGASLGVRPGLTHRRTQPFAAWPLLVDKGFWKQGAYFVFDGMGDTLRGAVFVAGAMTVLNSLSAFNVATALSSALSAGGLVVDCSPPDPLQPTCAPGVGPDALGPGVGRLGCFLAVCSGVFAVSGLVLLQHSDSACHQAQFDCQRAGAARPVPGTKRHDA